MRKYHDLHTKNGDYVMKRNFRLSKLLNKTTAVICIIAVLFSGFMVLMNKNDIDTYAEGSSSTPKMMYLYNSLVQTKSTTDPSASFVIPVTAGKKYVLSYDMKVIGYGVDTYATTSTGAKNDSVVKYANTQIDGCHYTHNVEVTSGTQFRATFKTKAYTNGNYPYTEMYITNFKMFEADNSYVAKNDTNLIEAIGNFSDWTTEKYKSGEAYSFKKGSNAFSAESGLKDIPNGFFENDESTLVSVAHVTNGVKGNFLRQYSILEPNKNYAISYSLKNVDGEANVYFKYFDSKGKDSSLSFTPVEVDDNYFEGTITTPSSLRKTKNIIMDVVIDEDDTEFYFGNYEIYELNAQNNKIGNNLALDPYFSNVVRTITLDKFCWITNNADSISFEPQTKNTFVSTESLKIFVEKSDAVLSQFVTAKPNTQYALTFDCKYKSDDMATPYIKAFASGTRTESSITDTTPFEYEDKYKKTYYFTTPSDLDTLNNLRIGLEFTNTVTGYFANFELYELDNNGVNTGDNLFENYNFSSKAKVINYTGEANNKWTKDGTFTTFEFSKIDEKFFNVIPKNMLVLEGKSSKTGDGSWGRIEQCATLVPGKKYMLSMDMRMFNQREGDTFGPKIAYQKPTSDKDVEFPDLVMAEEDDTYRRHYTFTMPTDARTTENMTNFRLRIWVSTAYCSGYFSDFELYELTAQNEKTGANILVDGSFESGTVTAWIPEGKIEKDVKALFNRFELISRVDDAFKKTATSKSTHILQYKNNEKWSYVAQYVTLKPDTNYIFKGQALHIINEEEAMSKFSIQKFDSQGDSYITLEKTVDANNITTATFTTPSDLRKEGDNIKVFLSMPGVTNMGYWGFVEIYELNEEGNPIGNNVLINGDFACGLAGWEVKNNVDLRAGKINDDSIFTTGPIKDYMIQATGLGKNDLFSQTHNLEAGSTYYFSGNIVNMNAEGVVPKVYYKAKGNITKQIDLVVTYDLERFGFDTSFTIPDDAKLDDSKKATVTVGVFSGDGGKAYLSNLMLTKKGEYINIFNNPNLTNSGSGWSYGNGFKVMPYDSSVFIFYFDDEAFDDGNWSGAEENGYAYVMGAVDGKVIDDDYNGISGITVKLNKNGLSAQTNEFGAFLFDSVQPGDYEVYIIYKGKEEFCTNITVEPGRSVSISEIKISTTYDDEEEYEEYEEDEEEIKEEETEKIDPSKCGVVVGKYIGEDGKPVKGVTIYLSKKIFTTTDKNGEFTFKNVPAGKYKVYILVSETKGKILKEIEVVAKKGVRVIIDESDPVSEDNYLWIILIIASGAVLLAGVATAVIIIIVKKRKLKTI